MYDYKARVVRWKDGDTVVLHVDQGFGNWTEQPFRLVGLYAPEANTPDGVAALARVNELAPVGAVVYVDSRRPSAKDIWFWTQRGRTFERWLAIVSIIDGPKTGDVADILISEGLGTRYGS